MAVGTVPKPVLTAQSTCPGCPGGYAHRLTPCALAGAQRPLRAVHTRFLRAPGSAVLRPHHRLSHLVGRNIISTLGCRRAAAAVISASRARVPLRPAGSQARSEMVALWFVSTSVCKSLRSWTAPFHLTAWLGDVTGSHREAEVGVQAHPLP